MSHLPAGAREQIGQAYRRMAAEARYRPAAPSDGFGNIPFPAPELDIDAESADYATRWWAEEDSSNFHIGKAHGEYRPAIIWAIEAARLLCGGVGSEEHAVKLLEMAADHMRPFVGRDLMGG